MVFRISDEIFKKFDGVIIGVIVCKNINNKGEISDAASLLRGAEEKVRETFSQFEFPQKHPYISTWRETYKKFGSSPQDYRCSIEALVRRVIKGENIRHINNLVDLYNYISLKYILPVGGEDLDSLDGDLMLDFAKGDEEFIRLGGEENEPPDVGEVVYKDNKGVLCRRWNWREGERTKLTEETKNAVLVIEGISPVTKEDIENASNELKNIVEKFCGGSISSYILGLNNQQIEI